MKAISVAGKVRAQVKRMRKAQPFTLDCFGSLGTNNQHAVRLAISRMVRRGELKRVYRGVYMRPKQSPYVGSVRTNAIEVARVLAKKHGHTLQVHGAEAVRRLGLSTQMQLTPTYYTSGPSCIIKIGRSSVRLQHKSPTWFQHADSKVGLVITALLYLGPKAWTIKTLSIVEKQLTAPELRRLSASQLPKWASTLIETLSTLPNQT